MIKISPKNFAEAFYEATKNKTDKEIEDILKNSTEFLYRNKMLSKANILIKACQDFFDFKNNIIRMKVISAHDLTPEHKKNIEDKIKEKYKANGIVSEFFENKNLLGGMRVEVKDEILDATYRNKLQKLEKFLIQN